MTIGSLVWIVTYPAVNIMECAFHYFKGQSEETSSLWYFNPEVYEDFIYKFKKIVGKPFRSFQKNCQGSV